MSLEIKHKKGSRVSGLCDNGTVLRTNQWRMCLVKWDYGQKEWVPDSSLKDERAEWEQPNYIPAPPAGNFEEWA